MNQNPVQAQNPTYNPRKEAKRMPLKKGASPQTIRFNVKEFHQGPTYQRTKDEFGQEKANKQAVAVAYSQARKSRK